MPEDFAVDMGRMDLLGPYPGIKRTCVSGQTCEIEIAGQYIGDQDHTALLDTCGVGTQEHVRAAGRWNLDCAAPETLRGALSLRSTHRIT